MSQYLLSSAGMVQPTRIVVSSAAAASGISALTPRARMIDKHLAIETFPFTLSHGVAAVRCAPPPYSLPPVLLRTHAPARGPGNLAKIMVGVPGHRGPSAPRAR